MLRKLTRYLLPVLALTSFTQAETLDSIVVTEAEVTRERLFDGVVEAIRSTTVSAQTQGRVIEINFDIDDFVQKDAVLLKISDHEQSARAAQANAAISQMSAQLNLAEANFRRFETLLASKTISQSEFDDAKTALQRARANMQTAQAAREEALKQVDYTLVRAPYSGIVTARLVELGEAVSPGVPLMSGFSLERMRVRTEVPNRFAQQIDENEAVDIVLDTVPAARVAGTEVTVFPFANPRSNSVTVRVRLPENTSGIYPGMLTKVAFTIERAKRILVPRSAVFSRSELTGVYVVEEERIFLRRLSIGRSYPGDEGVPMVEILSGLKPGERIASDPVAAVRALKAQLNTGADGR